jgi:hypothetical protein
MTDTTVSTIECIRELNDDFRRSFVGGAVMITAGVEAMPVQQRRSLLAKVRAFETYAEDNDPHGEHDFGAVDGGEVRYFSLQAYARADACRPPALRHVAPRTRRADERSSYRPRTLLRHCGRRRAASLHR